MSFLSKAEQKVDDAIKVVKSPPVPAFADIAKPTNDLLSRDFYHTAAANLEVKSKAPNGVNYTVKGKSAHDGPISGSLEGKYADKASGITSCTLSSTAVLSESPARRFSYALSYMPPRPASQTSVRRPKARPRPQASRSATGTPGQEPEQAAMATAPPSLPTRYPGQYTVLMQYRIPGTTGTLTWTTVNAIDAKLELDDNIAKGLKAEVLSTFKPDTAAKAAKLNLYFKQPQYNLRAFVDLLKGPTANVDVVLGHNGFVVGGEAGYDVNKAAITKYSAALGYLAAEHSVAVNATNNLSIFAASYFHKVNSQVQAGAKATWDSKSSGTVGLELAARYQLDPTAFYKAKINDRGVAALSYNTLVRPGFTFGVGASFDTQKLNEAKHTVGMHFAFEG